MRTLVCFIEIPESWPEFFVVDEDWSRFDDTLINQGDSDLEIELNALIYDEQGHKKIKMDKIPPKEYDIYIRCGFIS